MENNFSFYLSSYFSKKQIEAGSQIIVSKRANTFIP